jgi:hypothetical protein
LQFLLGKGIFARFFPVGEHFLPFVEQWIGHAENDSAVFIACARLEA